MLGRTQRLEVGGFGAIIRTSVALSLGIRSAAASDPGGKVRWLRRGLAHC